MMFFVMIFIVGASVTYPLGTLHLARTFDEKSQSLAGGIFNVAQQIGMALGFGVAFSISGSVSQKYNRAHPDLSPSDPQVLMVGFRAAAWALLAACGIALGISVVFLRGLGKVGKANDSLVEQSASSATIAALEQKDLNNSGGPGDIESAGAPRLSTASRPETAILRP
jgi:MFS family permease